MLGVTKGKKEWYHEESRVKQAEEKNSKRKQIEKKKEKERKRKKKISPANGKEVVTCLTDPANYPGQFQNPTSQSTPVFLGREKNEEREKTEEQEKKESCEERTTTPKALLLLDTETVVPFVQGRNKNNSRD